MDRKPVSSIVRGLITMHRSYRFALAVMLVLLAFAGTFRAQQKAKIPGKIALQLHAGGAGNMQFKDIWIRDLSAR